MLTLDEVNKAAVGTGDDTNKIDFMGIKASRLQSKAFCGLAPLSCHAEVH